MSDETTGTGPTPAEETTWLGPWQYDPAEEDDERTRRGFHPLQTGYLVVGLLALGIALMWLLTDAGVMETGDGGVAFSVVLIVSGAVGLVASMGRAMRRH